jgi:ribosomal protein S18 acetylase RimI-like enzyme
MFANPINRGPLMQAELKYFLKLYTQAFPEAERRVYDSEGELALFMASHKNMFHIDSIYIEHRWVGFISYWTFAEYTYIEHFAITESTRGSGIGNCILRSMCNEHNNMILEVEPPVDDISRKRISFYERHGFRCNKYFNYRQPSYAYGLPEVEMELMSRGNIEIKDYRDLAPILTNVYKQEL